jgi:hypothetical protein
MNTKKLKLSLVVLLLSLLAPLAARAATVTIADMPDYHWYYGCTPTSVGMIMGYYDRNGYANIVPGGVAPLTTYTGALGYNLDTGGSAMVASNAIASSGHIHDFVPGGTGDGSNKYNLSGDDLSSGLARNYGTLVDGVYSTNPHSYDNPNSFDCIADFLGTNQDAHSPWKEHVNSNGSSSFISLSNNAVWTVEDYINAWDGSKYWGDIALPGIQEWIENQGYTVDSLYHQATDNQQAGGFSFAQFQNEINNNRPVLISITGHSMVGYGYDTGTGEILVRDTWREGGRYDGDVDTGAGAAVGRMAWGGTYDGLALQSVVVIDLGGSGGGSPEPSTLLLIITAVGCSLLLRRERNAV